MSEPGSGVRVIGRPLSYADGAEEDVARIVSGAADRSSGSDELAAAIRDWPTRYHLARERANLLRPLHVRPGMRVLDAAYRSARTHQAVKVDTDA